MPALRSKPAVGGQNNPDNFKFSSHQLWVNLEASAQTCQGLPGIAHQHDRQAGTAGVWAVFLAELSV